MAKDKLEEISGKLWKEPTEKNWKSFGLMLKRSKAKYYHVVFAKGKLANKDDLRKAYAELYDAKGNELARVPVFMEKGRNVEGTTIFLKGLLNINK